MVKVLLLYIKGLSCGISLYKESVRLIPRSTMSHEVRMGSVLINLTLLISAEPYFHDSELLTHTKYRRATLNFT